MNVRSVRRIIVTHPWTSTTKGDLGVLLGLLHILRHSYPGARIQVLQGIGRWHPGHSLEPARRLYGVEELPDFSPLRVCVGRWRVEDVRHIPEYSKLNKLVRMAVLAENLLAWGLVRVLGTRARFFVGRSMASYLKVSPRLTWSYLPVEIIFIRRTVCMATCSTFCRQ